MYLSHQVFESSLSFRLVREKFENGGVFCHFVYCDLNDTVENETGGEESLEKDVFSVGGLSKDFPELGFEVGEEFLEGFLVKYGFFEFCFRRGFELVPDCLVERGLGDVVNELDSFFREE